MRNGRSDKFARYLLSPGGTAIISTLIFVLAWLFPPRMYRHYIDEPNFLFADPLSILYFLLCIGGFFTGLYIFGQHRVAPPLAPKPKLMLRLPAEIFLLTPLWAGIALNTLSMYLLITKNPLLVVLILAGDGAAAKTSLNAEGTEGSLGQAAGILLALTWWAYGRYGQIEFKYRLMKRVAVASLVLATFSSIAGALIKFGRYELMPVLMGLFLFLFYRKSERGVDAHKQLRDIAVFGGAIFGIFFLFSSLRGGNGISSFLGYTIASYNRMALLLSGEMHLGQAGNGVYLASFLGQSGPLNSIIPFEKLLHWPDFYDVWLSEFDAADNAGLNEDYIWVGAFGYIFSEIGWFAPVYVAFLGMLYGVTWISYRKKNVWGLIFYPWLAYNALFWFGTNMVVDFHVVTFTCCALLLLAYEWLFVKPAATDAARNRAPDTC